ncbi:MAG: ABC transporter ATP-binding protein [Agathobacter sp.]|nr:ABC transporter ATP-binding protein [Agathobacter sp.]
MELVIDRVSKQYKNKIAVDRISLKLEKGIYGLLGANGAGKTTLMRMICGILTPTSGTITYNGVDVSEEGYRAVLGYLPQDFGYYPDFSGKDFLLYMAALKGLSKKSAQKKVKELLELVSLEDVAKKKIKTYSGGMKQRLGIAQALLNDPEILILDEPTAGLDPKERVRFRNLIADLGKDNIVILSTHIVSDIDRIADHILMMNNGKLVFEGTREEITDDLEEFYLREFAEGEVK